MLSEQCTRRVRVSGIFDADHSSHPHKQTGSRARSDPPPAAGQRVGGGADRGLRRIGDGASHLDRNDKQRLDGRERTGHSGRGATRLVTAVNIDTTSPNPTVLGVSGARPASHGNIIVGSAWDSTGQSDRFRTAAR